MQSPTDHLDEAAPSSLLAGAALTGAIIVELVDSVADGVVLTDRDGRILLVNRQTEELFGYDRSELLGRAVEDLLPGRYQQVHRAHRIRYRAEPRTRPMGAGLELFGRRRDGTEFPVEISLSPLRLESGQLVVASVRDITDRVAAETEQRQLANLLDATRDAILIFDAETLRFTYVNQGAAEQLGYPRSELLTMTMMHLAPEFTEARLRKMLEQLTRGDVSSTMFTTTHRRSDGTDIPVEIILQPDHDDTGPARAFIMLARDISERVEAEEQLREAGEALRVLEDRERIARDLHDTVIQRIFAAGMSLQAVSTVLETHDGDAGQRLDRISDELDEAIRDLRNAIYALQPRESHRRGLHRDILQIIEDERPALGLEPRLRLDAEIDAIPDDIAEHLLAILREALSNVARHAHATTVAVAIEANDDDIVLRVVDNGVGIADARPAGNGLRNMADRAHQLGGDFRVGPQVDGQTQIEWRVPKPVP